MGRFALKSAVSSMLLSSPSFSSGIFLSHSSLPLPSAIMVRRYSLASKYCLNVMLKLLGPTSLTYMAKTIR